MAPDGGDWSGRRTEGLGRPAETFPWICEG